MFTIVQGDSLDLAYTTDTDEDLSAWTCTVQVRDTSDVLTAIDRPVVTLSSCNKSFIDRLTATETGALAVGTYTLSVQLSKAATGQAKEINDTITITKQFNY